MTRAAPSLEQLLRLHPDQEERVRYVDRAKRYRNECGCSMGGAFLAAAVLAVLANGLWGGQQRGSGLLIASLEQAAFVFVAGIIGKFVGIAIARIRLKLMFRELAARHLVGGG